MTSWRRAPFRRAERHRRAPGGPSSLLAVAAEPRSRIRRVEVGGPPRPWWFFAVERGGPLCVAPGLTEPLGITVQSATHPGASARAEADAEAAAWVAPGQFARRRHREARPTFQTCRVVQQDQPVLLAVDP